MGKGRQRVAAQTIYRRRNVSSSLSMGILFSSPLLDSKRETRFMFYLVIQTRQNFGSGATIRKRGRMFLARRVRRVRVNTEQSCLLNWKIDQKIVFDSSSLFVISRKESEKVYSIVKKVNKFFKLIFNFTLFHNFLF